MMIERNLSKTSTANKTTEPLAADAVWTGEWEMSSFDHAMISARADQDGTLFIEVGIPVSPTEVRVVLSRSVGMYADAPFFHPLVKGAARAFRLRYVNGPVPQTEMAVAVSFGDQLTVGTAGPDNQLTVTTLESLQSKFIALSFSEVIATEYAVLVDLSDTVNFPHSRVGHIDFSSSFITVDRDTNGTGALQAGVISRIDGTSADIEYLIGITFEKSSSRSITRDRAYWPNVVNTKLNGALPLANALTGFRDINVTSVNTGVSLRSPLGPATVTPSIGDIIVKATWTAGTYNASFSGHYIGQR